jgi:hypothetical protein
MIENTKYISKYGARWLINEGMVLSEIQKDKNLLRKPAKRPKLEKIKT